jgi:acetyl-CoA carboxylase biotin carboxyl carrier protein
VELGKIEGILKLMQSYRLQEIELKEGDDVLRVTQYQASAPMPAQVVHVAAPSPHAAAPVQAPAEPEVSSEKFIEVRSPFVGKFYAAPSPEAPPFVKVGQSVKVGATLCIVEAMKLMNEVEATHEGVIAKVLIKNEESVEYDQLLFLMKES